MPALLMKKVRFIGRDWHRVFLSQETVTSAHLKTASDEPHFEIGGAWLFSNPRTFGTY
jgi:hypothetical protein